MKQPLTIIRRVFQFVGVALLLALASCGASATRYKVDSAPAPKAISVTITQFEAANLEKLEPKDRDVREFEEIYFPGKLVSAFSRTPGCSGAYFGLDESPATDFVLRGEILESTGREIRLKVWLERLDGKVLPSKAYSVEFHDARPAAVRATLSTFLAGIASEKTNQALTSTNISLPQARTLAYAGTRELPMTGTNIENASLAGAIERREILQKSTQSLTRRIGLTKVEVPYLEWISVSAPLVLEKRMARKEVASGRLGQALSFAGMLASASVMNEAARQGNTAAVQQTEIAAMNFGQQFDQFTASASVAENKVTRLARTLASLKNDLLNGARNKEVTVRIYGRLLTLRGSQREQLAEFRRTVREKLNS